MRRSLRTLLRAAPLGVALLTAALASQRHAVADPATADTAERNERCATRLATAMVGESATPEALASLQPQDSFDTLVKDPRFVDRFSRFINSQFNRTPGLTPAEDAPYYMSKYVLMNNKPWSEMFLGKYAVVPTDANDPNSEANVIDAPNGLGYFRSRAWEIRYGGNEGAGVRLVTAYRIMQNMVGVQLVASTNEPNADVSVVGRKASQCATCHFTPWYALDSVASVLGTRVGKGADTKFDPPAGGPQTILGGVSVSNMDGLVAALANDESFNVNACRLTFRYLYGRDEMSCDGPAFDACVENFKKDKQITTALATVAKDARYCE